MYEIQRMGCSCRHDSSFLLDQPQGYDAYLMLYVKTPAFFRIGENAQTVEPGSFILYDRNTPLYYGAAGGDYVNDWMLFDCSEPLDAEIAIRFNTLLTIGDDVDIPQYFQLLADCYYRGGNAPTAALLIRAMLSEVFAERSTDPAGIPHYRELLDLRRQIYAQPQRSWTLKGMAAMLNISMPYLHSLYKKAFGATCMSDVIRSRMESAQQYLTNPSMSVEEIAYACGYSNSVHFSRQFKKEIGLSPQQWRRKGRNER
ncbi:MAG: helix-turn-helix transcriptional regulator [Oscillospiraceae bacterium]|nr:helix-turn-helix transcriptional regulator [Oscillospiraceae bacterium]